MPTRSDLPWGVPRIGSSAVQRFAARLIKDGILDEQQVRTVLNLQMQGDKRRFSIIADALGYVPYRRPMNWRVRHIFTR